jgi:hypothetical protein
MPASCRHFALIQEIREWFDGPLLLSGSIATGGAVLAAQAMGADLAYIGSPFIATEEARAVDAYKQGIVDGRGEDIVYTNLFHRRARATTCAAPSKRPGWTRTTCPKRSFQDELFRRLGQGQGLEGHLGLRPGHRRGQGGPVRCRLCRSARCGICGRARYDLRLDRPPSKPQAGRCCGTATFTTS